MIDEIKIDKDSMNSTYIIALVMITLFLIISAIKSYI